MSDDDLQCLPATKFHWDLVYAFVSWSLKKPPWQFSHEANVSFQPRSMCRLSTATLRAVCSELLPMAGKAVVPMAAQAASMATRVCGNTVRAVFARLAGKGFDVEASPEELVPAGEVAVQAKKRDAEHTLRLLVSEILANAFEGASDESLLRRFIRLEQAGLDLGDKCHDYRTLGYLLRSIFGMVQSARPTEKWLVNCSHLQGCSP